MVATQRSYNGTDKILPEALFSVKTTSLIQLLLAGFCLTSGLAWAEEAPTSEAPPWYQFEIIIFERVAPGAGSTEYWPSDPGRPSRLNALPINLRARPATDSPEPVAYQPLPASELRLSAEAAHLRRARNYRLLLHGAWRQPVVDPAKAQPLFVQFDDRQLVSQTTRGAEPVSLEGTIRVGVKRYLHLAVDLLLRSWPQDGGSSGDFRSYRMQANRRMRSGELHYLDHPLLGVLFIANRYQLPERVEAGADEALEVAKPAPPVK